MGRSTSILMSIWLVIFYWGFFLAGCDWPYNENWIDWSNLQRAVFATMASMGTAQIVQAAGHIRREIKEG